MTSTIKPVVRTPYKDVLGIWQKLVPFLAKKMQIPLQHSTEATRGVVQAFNSAVSVSFPTNTSTHPEGGITIHLDNPILHESLQREGVPYNKLNLKGRLLNLGAVKSSKFLLEETGVHIPEELAQREAALFLEARGITKKYRELLDAYARRRDFHAVQEALTIDEKVPLLIREMGGQAKADLRSLLQKEWHKIITSKVRIHGAFDDVRPDLRAMGGIIAEFDLLEGLMKTAKEYLNRTGMILNRVLLEVGFRRHEDGIGILLYTDKAGEKVDAAPLEPFRERERARAYFINPDSIETEAQRLENMFSFLQMAFVDWFSGKARQGRPIDYRGADELKERFLKELKDFNEPKNMTSEDKVLLECLERVLPQSSGFPDPRYLSHMASNIPFIALMATWIMAILNQNVIEQSEASATTTFVEEQVISWISHLIGFDPHLAGGSAVSGGSIANLTALAVARNKAFPEISTKGFLALDKGQGLSQGVIFCSQRAHYSIQKAAKLLGIGEDHVRSVPVDSRDRMDLNKLEQMIELEKSAGNTIVAVVGVAGTSETGIIDDLTGIGKICKREKIWFHVDAAYGGAALTSSIVKKKFKGIALADSVTIDGHKWFYVPFELGMIIFADKEDLIWIREVRDYTIKELEPDLGKNTLEGSRTANALKLWMTMKALGTKGYGHIIDHCIEIANYLRSVVNRHKLLEELAPSDLNFVAFRLVPDELKRMLSVDPERANGILTALNLELQERFKRGGKGFFAQTKLPVYKYGHEELGAIRSIIMNPFTTRAIIDQVVEAFIEAGARLWIERRDSFLSQTRREQ